jgi:2-furoyl-CoA dehydrogenase large subunit
LTGRGRYIDDLPTRVGTLHAAIVRSPHAHATISAIEVATARKARGVVAVLTGADIAAHARSMTVGVKANVECWPIARDRVRYVGEPVAVVVAEDRYLAEGAADLVAVSYEILPAVVDPAAAVSMLVERPPVVREQLAPRAA